MNEHVLILPWNEELISRIKGKKIIIETEGFYWLKKIFETGIRDNELQHIRIKFNACLTDIPFSEDWRDIPIVIYCHGIGDYKRFMVSGQVIRKLNVTIFFPSVYNYNYTELKILSSLGINCGILLNDSPVNWELMNDLMHYALYTRIKHGHIEPFRFIAKSYDPDMATDFRAVYFEDPSRFLHVNEAMNIALNSEKLRHGEFLPVGINELTKVKQLKEYKDEIYRWHDFFENSRKCSFCPAWRICLGKFLNEDEDKEECRTFFTDLLEAAEYHRNIISSRQNESNHI